MQSDPVKRAGVLACPCCSGTAGAGPSFRGRIDSIPHPKCLFHGTLIGTSPKKDNEEPCGSFQTTRPRMISANSPNGYGQPRSMQCIQISGNDATSSRNGCIKWQGSHRTIDIGQFTWPFGCWSGDQRSASPSSISSIHSPTVGKSIALRLGRRNRMKGSGVSTPCSLISI